MRIRGGHVAGLIVLGVTAFVIFATLTLPEAPDSEPEPVASLPPIDADPSLVPVIELASAELNCGTIPNQGVAHRTMTVFNRGKAPLVINDVRTSCACTIGRIPDNSKVIAPAGHGLIEILIDPLRIPGFHSRKTLTVFSNDPAKGTVQCDVIVDIEPEFEAEPEKLLCGAIAKGQEHLRTIRIRQKQRASFEVMSAKALPATGRDLWRDIKVLLEPVPEKEWRDSNRREYAVAVTIPEDVPTGALRRVIELETNVARVPRFRLEVEAEVEAPYTVSPAFPKLLMPRSPAPGEPMAATFTITGKEPIRVEECTVDSPFVGVTQRPGEAPNSVQLDVIVAENTPVGRTECTLHCLVKTPQGEYREWAGISALKLPTRD